MAMIELPVRTRGVCCDFEVAVQPAAAAGKVELLKALTEPTRLSMVALPTEARKALEILA